MRRRCNSGEIGPAGATHKVEVGQMTGRHKLLDWTKATDPALGYLTENTLMVAFICSYNVRYVYLCRDTFK